jgi:hypothetical protein
MTSLLQNGSVIIVADRNSIVRDRQLVIRREMDRRGISLKAVSFDSGIPYATIISYFPGERDREPATIPGGAIYALCEGQALPADLLSILLPDGFQIVRVSEGVDHDRIAEMAADYLATKNAAHHPESEAGRDLGPNEQRELDSKVCALPLRVAA